MAALRRGEQRAFDTLAARYEDRLLWFCRQILRSKEDAEDALQDVFSAAFKALVANEREIHVRPWLYRIARNRCINQLRRRAALAVQPIDDREVAAGAPVVDSVLKRQTLRDLMGDIKALPESQRTALLLREIDGFGYERIAVAMGTTVPAVKSLLVRARGRLVTLARARDGLLGPDEGVPGRRGRARTRGDAGPITYQAAFAAASATHEGVVEARETRTIRAASAGCRGSDAPAAAHARAAIAAVDGVGT